MLLGMEQMSINDANKKLDSSILKTPTDINTDFGDNYNRCRYYKVGTRVVLNVSLVKKNTSQGFSNVLLFTLPEGYRPFTVLAGRGCAYPQTPANNSTIQVYADGSVYGTSADSHIHCLIVFDAFN